MTGEIPFPTLTPWQESIWKSPKRHLLLMDGRRKGKTELLKLFAFRTAMAGGLVLWTSGTAKLAEQGFKELTEWLERYSARFAPSGKGIVSMGNGGEIRRVSAANATSGRGPTPALVIVDECQTVRRGFMDRARPSIMVSGGRMILAGTPPDSVSQRKDAQWIRDRLDAPENYPDWHIEGLPTTVDDLAFIIKNKNPEFRNATWPQLLEKAKQEMDELRQELGDENYQREILAKWVLRSQGRILNQFSHSNVDDKFGFDSSEGDMYWGFDRGEGKAFTVCLFCQVMLSKPGLRIIGEQFVKEIIDEGDFADKCVEYSNTMGWPMPKMGIYDVRAPRFKRALWERGIPPFGRNRVVNEGINLLNAGFRKGWINYHSRCVQLEHEMSAWQYKSSASGEQTGEPSDYNRDGADTLRYLYEYLIDHYGPHWRKLVKQEDMQGLQRTARDTVFTFSWL